MVTMYQRVLHKSRTALRATEDENWLKQEKLTGSAGRDAGDGVQWSRGEGDR